MVGTVDVRTETVIRRPVAEVAAFAGDPGNAPQWYVNIDSVEWRTPPPVAVGSCMDFVARFLGRRLAYTYEVVELVPDERLTMRTSDGPFEMQTSYVWESLGPRATRMTLTNRGRPTGFGLMVGPLMAFMMRRENRKDLERLKQMIESGEGAA